MKKIILASKSPSRKMLLEKIGLDFVVEASDFEEDMSIDLPAVELIQVLAKGKAENVAAKHEEGIVIGADTFIEFEGEYLGKPHTPKRAKEMLRRLSGKSHLIYTGFAVVDANTNKAVTRAVETKV